MKCELIVEMEKRDLESLGQLAEDIGVSATSLVDKIIKDALWRQAVMIKEFNKLARRAYRRQL